MQTLLLGNFRKHISLSEKEFEKIRQYFNTRQIRRKQVVLEAGAICREQLFINHGYLKAYYTDEKGKEHNQLFAFEEWWMSDLASFTTQTPGSLNIQAVEETEVHAIAHEDFHLMLTEYPLLEKHFRILFQNAFVAQQKKTLTLVASTVDERYTHFLNSYQKFVNRMSQQDIASFIGCTPEHLSYLRSQRAKGLS